MRLIAVHAIYKGTGVIDPGSPFVTDQREGESLLRLGAAVLDESPAPPEPVIPPQPQPAKGKR